MLAVASYWRFIFYNLVHLCQAKIAEAIEIKTMKFGQQFYVSFYNVDSHR